MIKSLKCLKITFLFLFLIAFSGDLLSSPVSSRKGEAVNVVYAISSVADLTWLTDPNALDATNNGVNDFASTAEKWAATYILTADIVFNADSSVVDWNGDGRIDALDLEGLPPIGNADVPFSGKILGNYRTISNIYINGHGYRGLFGQVRGAVIENLGLDNIRVYSTGAYNGGLIGRATIALRPNEQNLIKNSYIKGRIEVSFGDRNAYTGGIVGRTNNMEILNSYSMMVMIGDTINENRRLAGIAGHIDSGPVAIANSYSVSEILAWDQSGLLVGRVAAEEGMVRNSYAKGRVTGSHGMSDIGALIGQLSTGSVLSCYFDAEEFGSETGIGGAFVEYEADPLSSAAFSDSTSFVGWDFTHTWYMGSEGRPQLQWEKIDASEFDYLLFLSDYFDGEVEVIDVNYSAESNTVSGVLRDGAGDFDPWNTERWANWYNNDGQIIKPFELDTTLRFMEKSEPWTPKIEPSFDHIAIIEVSRQGIVVDGNGIVIDIQTEEIRNSTLNQLYGRSREPWMVTEVMGIFYNLPEADGVDQNVIRGFTLVGFNRGLRHFNRPVMHPLLIENVTLIRNRFGLYTNGNNLTIQDCDFIESGFGAIYSGHNSHSNRFIGNRFRDNTISQYNLGYGEFIGDCFYNSEVVDNEFLPSASSVSPILMGISVFRNQGEDNSLRRHMPHNNLIKGNKFDGYSVAVHIGTRHGRSIGYDITGEGLDYAFYNTIEGNIIENTAIGIKVNTEGNTISNNVFSNVDEEIVLHCVFFSLKNTTINHQENAQVRLWYVLSDYTQYRNWFPFQGQLNASYDKSEKLIEVFSDTGTPQFPEDLGDIFVLNPEKDPEYMLVDHRLGLPSCVQTGTMSRELPGQEYVAIWNDKIARVRNVDYYSILIFDEHGTEINRCGLSEVMWQQIAVGYFVRSSGEMEIAAVPATPVNGRFPVYIFRRGFREPTRILHENNTNPNIRISTDDNHQLVVQFDSGEVPWGLERTTEEGKTYWLIESEEDLLWLSDPVSLDATGNHQNDFSDLADKWSANYRLTSDIVFDPEPHMVNWHNTPALPCQQGQNVAFGPRSGFRSIGNENAPFTGHFDGGYHNISNLYMERSHNDAGFFGVINNATIENLKLKDVQVNAPFGSYRNIGGIAGRADMGGNNKIMNSSVTGRFDLTASAQANLQAGGIVGKAANTEITGCFAQVVLHADTGVSRRLGGIAGQIDFNSRIENCYSLSDITAFDQSGSLIGRIWGDERGNVLIMNNYASGIINEGSSMGVFIGLLQNAETVASNYYHLSQTGASQGIGINEWDGNVQLSGLSSAEFANAGNFTGWDFNEIWAIGKVDSIARPFLRWQLHVDVGISPENAGVVSGIGLYEKGEDVTVSATANAGYTFLHWTDGSGVVSEEAEYSFEMPGSIVRLTANFDSGNLVPPTGMPDEVVLYPNPAKDSFTLTSAGIVQRIEILDIQGRLLHAEKIGLSQVSVNIGMLRAGTYIVRVHTEHGFYSKILFKSE